MVDRESKRAQPLSYFGQLKDKSRKTSHINFNSAWESQVEEEPETASTSMMSNRTLTNAGNSQAGNNQPSIETAADITQRFIDDSWLRAKESCKQLKYSRRQQQRNKTVQPRSGWKTVRLFVSSTFHDFQAERDLLVKKVFPDLKRWCFDQKIHFVEIDLRWGVPQGADAEVALRTCLGELERCYSDNEFPFFLNMHSERIGWLPVSAQVPKSIREEFDWIDGLSITEMEVLHGAIRSKNPNAFFLVRHPSFLQTVPADKRNFYQDAMPLASYKTIKFREVVDSFFGEDQKVTYYARYEGQDSTGYPQLTGYQDLLARQVLEFFKKRIQAHYPLGERDESENVSEWEKLTEMHESFMSNEARAIGKLPVWDKQIADLMKYVEDPTSDVPYLLKAKSGSGKSSCLSTFITRVRSMLPDTKVFCHFVGAVPGSIDYHQLVRRIALFLGECVDGIESLESIIQSLCRKLSSNRDQNYLIVIDAYNQLTEPSVTWLPYPLSPQVKVVITARPESGVTELIQQTYPKPLLSKELIPIDESGKREMVSAILGNYNKKLDAKQMDVLLRKESSSSYYWLSLACEELRIYGHFEKLTEKVETLPDDLVDLQMDILKRLESEQPREELLVATVCLLLVSRSGLLEIELLELLAEPPNLLPRALREGRYDDKLPFKVWSEIMRDLRSFVKSMGDPSEGRLKVYHATFSMAVRKLYFEDLGGAVATENFKWFHGKLADYFKTKSTFERRLEEYPYHLAFLGRIQELSDFLCEWQTIKSYYHPRFAKHLSHLWSAVDSEYATMEKVYVEKVISTLSAKNHEEKISAVDLLKLANICFQNGRYIGCDKIIQTIEEAEHTMSELIDFDDSQTFTAEMKYVKAKSTEKSAQMKNVLALAEDDIVTQRVETLLLSALDSLRKLESLESKRKVGELENRMGMFHIRKMFALECSPGKLDEFAEANCRERAVEWVMRAQNTFKAIGDQIGVADTFTSLAVCSKDAEDKWDYFEKAEKIIGKAGGSTEDAAIGRLYMNLGIMNELKGFLSEAKEYYRKYLLNSRQLFGEYHPETRRAKEAIEKLAN